MRARLDKMSPLLCLGLDEVRIIGIVGQHGIGKTTCTKVIFNRLSREFEGSIFIENIKEPYIKPTCPHLICQNDEGVVNLEVERERLKGKRVLMVIANVDRLIELEDIMKETQCFGLGSRVIVTVQDKELLKKHRIDHVYEVALPSDSEAFEIFCMAAFGYHFPKDGFEDLARKLCNAVCKLPKGLKFTGTRFRGMSKQQWIDEIEYLECYSSPLAKALPYKEKID